MAKVGLRQTFEMETRNKVTKVNCDITFNVDGRELPNMSVLGAALEEATQLIQTRVAESYKEVPARVGDPEAAVKATVAHVNRDAGVQLTDDENAVSVVTPKVPEPAVPFGATKPWELK